MVHLSSFKAVNYRGINGLSLPRLSRANFVTGVNGVGKTALLEAIWLFVGRYSPSLLWNGNIQRSGSPVLDPVARLSDGVLELHGAQNGSARQLKFKTVFKGISDVTHRVITGNDAGEKLMQLPIVGRIDTYLDGKIVRKGVEGMQPTPQGFVAHKNSTRPADWPAATIDTAYFESVASDDYFKRYSDLVRDGRKQEMVNILDMLLHKVKDIEILTDEAGRSYFSVETDRKQLPLEDHGGGVVRLFRLLLSFFVSRNGLLLVDEVEYGMHHSVLEEVWRRAREWVQEWNVQFFAATHSAECIDAVMKAFADAPEDLSVHHLFRNSETGNIEVVTFSGDTLEGARDLNLEMR